LKIKRNIQETIFAKFLDQINGIFVKKKEESVNIYVGKWRYKLGGSIEATRGSYVTRLPPVGHT
jgi:hypothetical protein